MAFWILLLIQVGLQILSGLLTNKNAKAEKKLDLPHIDAATPIPVPFGICLIEDPMLVDYLDFKTEAIKIRNPATFFITTTTTGYYYYIGMVFGLCWGYTAHEQKTRLLQILIDNREAWKPVGLPGDAPRSGGQGIQNGDADPIVINRPSFFGSEKQQGGVRAECYWYCGMDTAFPDPVSTQDPNAYWEAQRALAMPNYKDIAYFVWHGPSFGLLSPTYGGKRSGLIGNAPRLWPLAFKVSRFPRYLTEGVYSNQMSDVPYADNPPVDSYIHANPIDALYECLISTQWGAGISPAHIYGGLGNNIENQFAAAAGAVYFEGLAFAYLWSSASPVEEMISEILRYVDGALWTDPADGLIKFKLARFDYTPALLPVLSNDDFIEISSFTRGSWRETKSEVRVSFPDQSKSDFEMNTATWRNPANFQIQGANEPMEITFRGCPSLRLANRLAAREGKVVSTPLAKLRGTIDRKVWQFHPCSVFKFNWPEQGISDLIMRVTTMNLGTLMEGTIEIQAAQDVFAEGVATYSPTTSTIWTDPLGGEAEDSPFAAAGEIPYWIQRDDVPRAFGVASRPSSAHPSYDGSLDGEVDLLGVEFTPTGTLLAALDQLSGTDYNTAGFVVEDVVDADQIVAGDVTSIPTEGSSLAIIGDPNGNHEWIAFEGFVDNEDGTVDLDNIWRGLLDTPPRDWPIGTRVYFYSVGSSLFVKALADADVAVFEALTQTMRDQLLAADATNHNHTMQSRALRPLPPYYVRMGGSYTNELQATGDVVFTWREHSRLTALEILKQSAATDTAEASTTYEIDIFGEDDVTLLRAVTGLSSPTYTYTNADELSDSGTASLQVRLRAQFYSRRDGLRSLFPWIRYVYRSEIDTIRSVSAVTAALSVSGGLGATVASVSAVSGALTTDASLAATVASVSAVAADLTNTVGVDPDLVLHLAARLETGYSNNDPVTSPVDFSSAGQAFTQSTSGSKPLYQTGVLNGQPGFFFDGTDDFWTSPAFMTGDAEMWLVVKISSVAELKGAYKFDGGTDANHMSFAGTVYTSFGSASRYQYTPSPTSNLTDGMIHIVVAQAGASNYKVYENGDNLKITQSPTQSWSGGASPVHLIGASSTGANGSPAGGTNQNVHGHYLEMRIYSSPRSTAQRNAILAEFNTLFGIPVTNF